MIKWLKQLFCCHVWKWDEEHFVLDKENPRFVCSKCGKREGL